MLHPLDDDDWSVNCSKKFLKKNHHVRQTVHKMAQIKKCLKFKALTTQIRDQSPSFSIDVMRRSITIRFITAGTSRKR